VTIVETQQLRTEADRKNQNFDPAPARDQKVAKLMEKNHGRQHEQKWNNDPQHA
jgi:hypothetical protein